MESFIKKAREYGIIITFLLILLIGATVSMWTNRQLPIESFYENNSDKITSIEVVNSTNGSTVIKDKDYINAFSEYLSQIELKKVKLGNNENSSNFKFIVYEGNTDRFEISFSGTDFCNINNSNYKLEGTPSVSFDSLTNAISSKYLNIVFEYDENAWAALNLDNALYSNKDEFEKTIADHIFNEEETSGDFFWYKDFGKNINSLLIKVKFWPGTIKPISYASYYDDTTITTTINLNKRDIETGSTSLLDEVAHVLITSEYHSLKN